MKLKRLIAKGLRAILQPPAITDSIVDKKAKICSGTQFNYSKLDRYSYVGHDCFVLDTEIGPFCSISDNCRIGGAEHPLDRLSTSPVFHDGKNIFGVNLMNMPAPKGKKIIIGPDVWIGANVIIKSGINIGLGSVIGAGAVVTKDVPPYAIVAGNPAKIKKYRFNEEKIKSLVESKWWERSEEELKTLRGIL